tara:strand:+ start:766 stop:1041 length:276 start_codon:yes stop_codon:yes gene_type:complete
MKEEELVALGNDSENLLGNSCFSTVVNSLVDSSFQAFVNTSPEDVKGRERCYSQYRALVDVTNTLRHNMSVRDEIVAKYEKENSGNNNQED